VDATDAHSRVIRLQVERYEALAAGVDPDSSYMQRLAAAIREARHDYVTSAVVEIAALRTELNIPVAD
jgi:hypothetical protein